MTRLRSWVWGLVILTAVWSAAAGVIIAARAWQVTADDVAEYAEARSLDDLNGDARADRVAALADMVNRLPLEDRRRREVRRAVRARFMEMTPDERAAYLDATLPRGMQQMMQAINDMPREERRQLVERALDDMRSDASDRDRGQMVEAIGQEAVDRIVEEGMRSYLRDAHHETKLDLQPLVEQMQITLRGAGR